MPIASFFGSIYFFSILVSMASVSDMNSASMFWPDFAEHYMNNIPLFFAIWNPSSYETVRLL
jgi:hypothetical protein